MSKGNKHRQPSRDRIGYVREDEERMANPEKFDPGSITCRQYKFRSVRQERARRIIDAKPVTFLVGPAGTAKTWLACSKAAEDFCADRIKRIVIARAVIEGEDPLGFMPGDLRSKVEHHMKPAIENLAWFMGNQNIKMLQDLELIEVSNMGLLRGRTFNDTVIILDEFQNNTAKQLKTALTRLGTNTRVIACGDAGQIDLEDPTTSCVYDLARFKGSPSVGYMKFGPGDVERSELCREMVAAYED